MRRDFLLGGSKGQSIKCKPPKRQAANLMGQPVVRIYSLCYGFFLFLKSGRLSYKVPCSSQVPQLRAPDLTVTSLTVALGLQRFKQQHQTLLNEV